jgi:hypothetical protein
MAQQSQPTNAPSNSFDTDLLNSRNVRSSTDQPAFQFPSSFDIGAITKGNTNNLEEQIQQLKQQQAALPNIDLNKIFSDTLKSTSRVVNTSIPALTPSGSMPASVVSSEQQAPSPASTNQPTTGSGRGNRKYETAEQKKERIKQRNRDHARRCRQRKKELSDELANRTSQLEYENNVLKTAFRELHSEKLMIESLIISEFGERGYTLIERTREVKVEDQAEIPQLCEELMKDIKHNKEQECANSSGESTATPSPTTDLQVRAATEPQETESDGL